MDCPNWQNQAAFVALLMILGALSLGNLPIEVSISPDETLELSVKREPWLTSQVRKDLASGITTEMAVLIRLEDSLDTPRPRNEKLYSFKIKYDLWEERFYIHEAQGRKWTVEKPAALEEWIEAPGPFILAKVSELPAGQVFKARALQTFNPFNKERYEAVQKWAAGHNTRASAGVTQVPGESTLSMSESAVAALFHQLWKRASSGEILGGELKREGESAEFTIDTLRIRRALK